MDKVLHSSKKTDWETPQAFFDRLDAEFHFDLDAAANYENRKCRLYYSPKMNALITCWSSLSAVWLNPPYGRSIGKWLEKAYKESLLSVYPIVCLIPARTDTVYWHDYVMRADEIRFIKGRLRFVGAEHAAPFPSVIVVFRGGSKRRSPKVSTY